MVCSSLVVSQDRRSVTGSLVAAREGAARARPAGTPQGRRRPAPGRRAPRAGSPAAPPLHHAGSSSSPLLALAISPSRASAAGAHRPAPQPVRHRSTVSSRLRGARVGLGRGPVVPAWVVWGRLGSPGVAWGRWWRSVGCRSRRPGGRGGTGYQVGRSRPRGGSRRARRRAPPHTWHEAAAGRSPPAPLTARVSRALAAAPSGIRLQHANRWSSVAPRPDGVGRPGVLEELLERVLEGSPPSNSRGPNCWSVVPTPTPPPTPAPTVSWGWPLLVGGPPGAKCWRVGAVSGGVTPPRRSTGSGLSLPCAPCPIPPPPPWPRSWTPSSAPVATPAWRTSRGRSARAGGRPSAPATCGCCAPAGRRTPLWATWRPSPGTSASPRALLRRRPDRRGDGDAEGLAALRETVGAPPRGAGGGALPARPPGPGGAGRRAGGGGGGRGSSGAQAPPAAVGLVARGAPGRRRREHGYALGVLYVAREDEPERHRGTVLRVQGNSLTTRRRGTRRVALSAAGRRRGTPRGAARSTSTRRIPPRRSPAPAAGARPPGACATGRRRTPPRPGTRLACPQAGGLVVQLHLDGDALARGQARPPRPGGTPPRAARAGNSGGVPWPARGAAPARCATPPG